MFYPPFDTKQVKFFLFIKLKSAILIRTLCATCLRHFVEAKAFKIALVPSADRSMDTCTVCQTRRGHDYVVMHR